MLGSSGEDPTGVYVEELIDAAYEARDGYTMKVLDIVTEVPRKRTGKKGVNISNRHATYKEFSIVQVDNEMDSLRKTTREFKQSAQKTLFAQAMDVARTNGLASAGAGATSLQDLDFDSNTFLTATVGPGSSILHSRGTGANRDNEVADAVMTEIANEMNLMDLTDIRALRDKMRGGGFDKDEATVLPVDLFSRSMTKPSTLATYPLAMNTAIKSLRFAINHPLTNHDEVPSSSMFPPHHHVNQTAASLGKQVPRRVTTGIQSLETVKVAKNSPKPSADITVPKSPTKDTVFGKSVRSRRKSALRIVAAQQARSTTLQQIEDVLDGLNRNAQEMATRAGQHHPVGPDNVIVKGVARPNTGIKGLVDMVNTVMYELES